MIARSTFVASMVRAADLLVSRGYEVVLPVESSFLARYIPLHLAGLKGDYEMIGVKLRVAYGSVSTAYVESFCRYEICQFRSLLTMNPGNLTIRCEVWVVSPTGAIHCYEVLHNGIREVAAYAR